jgi:flagellar hook-associated protein 2
MTAKKDGYDDKIGFPELYFLDGKKDIYFDGTNDAENAIIRMDGFEIETDSNDVTDFLTGINLHIKQANPEKVFQVNVTEDYQKISGKVKTLVEQINGVLEFINKQNQVDDKTDTASTFAGDSGLQTIEYRLRNILHEAFPVGTWEDEPTDFVRLNELGFEFAKNGQVLFKEDKFTKAMETNFDRVADAMTGNTGFATQLRGILGGYSRTGNGFMALREQGIKTRIKNMDDDIANKEARLAQRQERLVAQFSRLQGSLSDLQRQGAALGSLGGGGGGGNLVSQLLGG